MVVHKSSDKKPSVVLDIGTAFTKAGYAGDDKPICIVRSKLDDVKGEQWLKDIQCPQELRRALRKFLRIIYLRHLLVSMGDRSVIVCEQLLCPRSWKDALAHVLLIDYEVPAVVFAPRHLLSLYTLGITTGLVVHSGHSETLILPIYENMLSETGRVDVRGELQPIEDIKNVVTREQLEDIKVRTCFVTRFDRAQSLRAADQADGNKSAVPSVGSDILYPLTGNMVLHIPGRLRETACEQLFDSENSEHNLACLVLDSILQCPIDSRRKLAGNIVLIGGNTMLPGFKHRLQQELKSLCKQPQYADRMVIDDFAFHKTVTENYAAWLGGAIFGASGRLDQYSVTRDEFEALNYAVPDWSTYIPHPSTDYDTPV
ncbi:actin-related protein 10-like isoform X2 [Watersipora subatra]|uniref:actin-related protein 10-like isoform X2 n=1 Tax=Watersipora subatra TaxID=2589382 RepID=UPI00355B1460